mmetsp:Transcript_49053/g.157092  ORF Transcript_49053/g.157092 Transcript_49053/m.157092 type:complete len:281 (-) Transcript_49053:262-1104(-)
MLAVELNRLLNGRLPPHMLVVQQLPPAQRAHVDGRGPAARSMPHGVDHPVRAHLRTVPREHPKVEPVEEQHETEVLGDPEGVEEHGPHAKNIHCHQDISTRAHPHAEVVQDEEPAVHQPGGALLHDRSPGGLVHQVPGDPREDYPHHNEPPEGEFVREDGRDEPEPEEGDQLIRPRVLLPPEVQQDLRRYHEPEHKVEHRHELSMARLVSAVVHMLIAPVPLDVPMVVVVDTVMIDLRVHPLPAEAVHLFPPVKGVVLILAKCHQLRPDRLLLLRIRDLL